MVHSAELIRRPRSLDQWLARWSAAIAKGGVFAREVQELSSGEPFSLKPPANMSGRGATPRVGVASSQRAEGGGFRGRFIPDNEFVALLELEPSQSRERETGVYSDVVRLR